MPMKTWWVLLSVFWCNLVLADSPLLGAVTEQQILSDPAYAAGWRDYSVPASDPEDLATLDDLQLVVLFGFWCHDSEREVPRLMKAVAQARLASVRYIAVDRDKKAPGNVQQQYDLKYTPTVILFDGQREIGRIIEQPDNDWVRHLARIRRTQPR